MEGQLGNQERTAEAQGSHGGGRGDGRVLSAGDTTRRYSREDLLLGDGWESRESWVTRAPLALSIGLTSWPH